MQTGDFVMKKDYFEDLFLHQQPTCTWEELSAPLYSSCPENWNKRLREKDEAVISGVVFDFDFPDESGLLETAYSDLKEFVRIHCPKDGIYTIRTELKEGMKHEEHCITVSSNECVISASDTEGIRRALYYIEDEMIRRKGPFLPYGSIVRQPHIKKRITRNFYTPHEANLELKDDIDYYPENYLSRLSHDGVNGLWMFVRLRDFVPSDIVPEYGIGGEAQLKKLNEITKKCARYGIGVYCLGVEPASSYDNEILEKNHSDMLGANFWNTDYRAICPSTPKGSAYAKECMYKLFTLVPDLAGFISITTGEAVAGCGGVGTPDEINCPRCKAAGLTKPMALAKTESLMQEGMKKAKPDAEFISWTYGARSWTDDMIIEHCRVRDASIPIMNNFEDKGTLVQLGKERKTLDYWLSYPGPGDLFTILGENAPNSPLYAKIQVCCSHELATVPYVPVPGILYDKYSAMLNYGTEGVMYCWFFGNYPGMMNKAAGELAFLPFFESKEEFLYNLALLYTTPENAPRLTQAWQLFEKGYTNCPYNVLFAWFGLLNDAPARPLHLLPVDIGLPSNWLLSQSVEGDRFGECIGMMHSPEEVFTLLSQMKEMWEQGLDILNTIEVPDEMKTLSNAIGILMNSAYNVLKFYLMRNELGYGNCNKDCVLSDMKKIVCEEIENSLLLADICKKDSRLGYHSEAVGYKFFPEKLNWRVSRLEEISNSEFPEVEKRISDNLSPLAFFDGEGMHTYSTKNAEWENFMYQDRTFDNDTRIKVDSSDEFYTITIEANHTDDIVINAEFTMFVPYVPVRLHHDGSFELCDMQRYFLTDRTLKEETEKWHVEKSGNTYIIKLKKEDFNLSDKKVFRIAVCRDGSEKTFWEAGENEFFRLAYGRYRPDSKVFIK